MKVFQVDNQFVSIVSFGLKKLFLVNAPVWWLDPENKDAQMVDDGMS